MFDALLVESRCFRIGRCSWGQRWRLPSSPALRLDFVLSSVLIPPARNEPAPDEKSAHKVHYSASAFRDPGEFFAERFAGDVLAPSARRTGRLGSIAASWRRAGGCLAASFARRLTLPVSNDTLLCVVRRRAVCRPNRLNVIGIGTTFHSKRLSVASAGQLAFCAARQVRIRVRQPTLGASCRWGIRRLSHTVSA